MHSRILLIAIFLSVFALPAAPGNLHADARTTQTLTALVGPHSLTRDTNGDSLPDSVAARIIVPAAPSLADVEAATNLAARLGYETTAFTLPLVVRDSDVAQPASVAVPILIGRTNRFVRQLIDAKAIEVGTLKAGQGLVAAVASPLGGGGRLVLRRGDGHRAPESRDRLAGP